MAAVAGSAAFSREARTQARTQEALFVEVCTNHDGYINLKENDAANEKRFRQFDKNDDGRYSRRDTDCQQKKFSQFDETSTQAARLYLGRMDKYGDDAASCEEFRMGMDQQMFVPWTWIKTEDCAGPNSFFHPHPHAVIFGNRNAARFRQKKAHQAALRLPVPKSWRPKWPRQDLY